MSQKTFSYFGCPIDKLSDDQLISWCIMFLNGADLQDPKSLEEWEDFRKEINNRSEDIQKHVEYLIDVI